MPPPGPRPPPGPPPPGHGPCEWLPAMTALCACMSVCPCTWTLGVAACHDRLVYLHEHVCMNLYAMTTLYLHKHVCHDRLVYLHEHVCHDRLVYLHEHVPLDANHEHGSQICHDFSGVPACTNVSGHGSSEQLVQGVTKGR
eukprot:940412-Pelagomonas_calceolata.AAC.1